MGLKIIVLTDHSTHSIHNSLYGLTKALLNHPEIEKVDLITRSDQRNADFFNGIEQANLIAHAATHDFDYPADRFFEEDTFETQLGQYDFMLLRLPRPVTAAFFKQLINSFPENCIINRPSGIIKTGSKEYLLNFQKYTAPVKVCRTIGEITSFKDQFPIVLKPFEEYGGKGIIRIDGDSVWLGNEEQISFSDFKKQYALAPTEYLAMKFLKNVTKGDKRIVVANGRILASSLRIPGEGMWLCNVAQGGSASAASSDERELEIIRHINPTLKKEGIFLYGLDTLEDDNGIRVISEVNTLSVGGITPAEIQTGHPITKIFADEFVKYVRSL
ncbi:MAG: glutathione synthase [Saprospiraceae bacterium]|jgi:glutathione synthase